VGILFDFSPQVANVGVQNPGVIQKVGIPHFFHQKLAAEDPGGVAHKEGQELALFGVESLRPIAA